MIRIIAILAGLGFAFVALISLGFGIGPAFGTLAQHGKFVEPTVEYEFHKYPRELDVPTNGFFAQWDVQQLQRGYKVYKQVCSACHGLEQVAFRNLADLGYSDAQIKAEAATWQVPGVDPNTGEATMRPALPTDYFPSPYPNEIAARAANNNAIPPDLSLITKARHDGTNYVYSLLAGYEDPPAELTQRFPEFTTPTGLYYNPYFHSLNIAMPPQLSDGAITYDDGTEATVDQMAGDVAAFLQWTAEPTLVKRKQTGFWFLGFMIFATVLAWMAKNQVWASAKPRKGD